MKKSNIKKCLFSLILMNTLFFFPVNLYAQPPEKKWDDNISLSGDIRLRWESITKNPGSDTERERFRSRFGMATNLAENVKLIFRIESGIDDPVSSNQTFGNGLDIGIGRAYADWEVNNNTRILGGKMKLPWFVAGGNSVLWDSDFNPEGVFASFQSNNNLFGNIGYTVVNRGSNADNVALYSTQIGSKFNIGNSSTLTTGFGYFDYNNAIGRSPFYKSKGNNLDGEGNYLYDYTLVEFFAEYKTKISELPVTYHLEWIKNTAVDDEDNAYSIGVNLGSASKQGGKQFSYAYHDTETDAVIGSFTDSDFAGGNTDSKGHILKTKYSLRDNITLGGVLVASKYGAFTDNEIKFNRFQLDLEFQF